MRMHTADVVELNRRAVRASVDVVALVTAADLRRPTPCADWTLAELLAHMTAQHHGFAAAAGGRGTDPQVWRTRPLGTEPAATYAAAAGEVLAAFAAAGVLDARFALPEISAEVTFSGRRAIGFHLVDYVVHAWDVARALDLRLDLPDDVVRGALPIAEAVPDGPGRLLPGAAFAPGLPVPAGADAMDRLLALLGRSPTWPA
jgi:uncharacterized protein (TIGR03086 family)